MSNSSDYIDYLVEHLAPIGLVTARSMFGGHGIYCDGRMFGLVAQDVLYLKVDDINRAHFEAKGLGPFRYEKAGGAAAVMSYYECPSAALDDQDILLEWARLGMEAALRAPAKPKKRRKSKKS